MVKRITTLVKQKGLSLSAVEKKLGFGNGAIRRFDTNSPSIDKIVALSNFLNVSIDYLVNGKEMKNEQLNEDELEMLKLFRKLPYRQQIKMIGSLEILSKQFENDTQNINPENTSPNETELKAKKRKSPVFEFKGKETYNGTVNNSYADEINLESGSSIFSTNINDSEKRKKK